MDNELIQRGMVLFFGTLLGVPLLYDKLTIRFVSNIVFLSKSICQHGMVPGLESQRGKLTGILKKAL